MYWRDYSPQASGHPGTCKELASGSAIIHCPLQSLDKAPKTHPSHSLSALLRGKEVLEGQPFLTSARENWHHSSPTSTQAFPGAGQKPGFHTPKGELKGFFHPASPGKLFRGAAFHLWSLKHSSIPALSIKQRNPNHWHTQVQMSATDKSGLYSYYKKPSFLYFFSFLFLSKDFPILLKNGQDLRYWYFFNWLLKKTASAYVFINSLVS